MASTNSNNSNYVYLGCNNRFISGTTIVKKFKGVPYEGRMLYYNKEEKNIKYHFQNITMKKL